MKNKNNLTVVEVPTQVLGDLKLRAEENGRTLEAELTLRLSLSLERDLQMIQEDNECALQAFEVAQQMQEAMRFLNKKQ